MKIIYIATSVIPAEKANSYQVMKMCEAFTKIGVKLELIIPIRWGGVTLRVDPFKYYGLREKFKIKKIFSLDLIPFKKFIGHIGFWIQNISFALLTSIYLLFKKPNIIYSRDRFTLLFLSFFKKNLVYEVHSLPKKIRFYEKFLYHRAKKIIVITKHTKKALLKKVAIEKEKVFIAPDAVDLEMFDKIGQSKEALRKDLNLPINKKLISYIGQLYTKGREKGITDMLQALKILRKEGRDDLMMLFVGGEGKDIEKYQNTAKEIGLKEKDTMFLKKVSFTDVPKYEKASDILVIPFPWEKHYAYYASPLKMFEYMASKRPIIASDLPSLREILNNKSAIFVKPDNPKSLAGGIKQVLNNPELAKQISNQAFNDVQKYTWQKRAEKVIHSIST